MKDLAESLTIDHVGHRGDGVAYHNDATAFVPYSLPGELVTTDAMPGHPDRRRLIHIETPSAARIAPFCEYFTRCGGCAIQHWRPDTYRAWKRQIVVDTLDHAGIDCAVDDLIDAHGAGRRRLTVHARRDNDGALLVGFAAAGSHAIVAIAQCPILDPALSGALGVARVLADVLKVTNKPLDIQMTAARNGLDVDVRGTGPLPTAMIATLSRIAEQHNLARLTRHGELVLMRTPPVVAIGPANVSLPPGSFLQATTAGEDALGALVVKHAGKSKQIADLFCGVGPFALRLAARARVLACDSEADAIVALQKAAKSPGLKPLKAETRDLFRRPLAPQELRDVDCVVFDPPRQGALAQVTQLAKSNVPVVIAVSCNVQTFARDAKVLIAGGYRIESVTPLDQFRHTPHVELVARFVKGQLHNEPSSPRRRGASIPKHK